MFIGLIEFARKKEKESKLRGTVEVAGGAYLLQQGVRSGLPRALGVRLESHTTSRKNARKILKTGYLDPAKSGGGATAAFDGIDESLIGDRAKVSKGKVFITGAHKDAPIKLGPLERIFTGSLRRTYRGNADFTPEDWKISGKMNQEKALKQAGQANKLDELMQTKEAKRVMRKSAVNQLPIINHLKGRSLYIGGSDKFFDSNFQVDPDIPFAAMMSSKKIPVSGSRLGATVKAIKREGLGNLVKGNKGRVATGAALLGGSAYVGQKLVRNGIKKLSAEHRQKIGRGVRKAHKSGKFR